MCIWAGRLTFTSMLHLLYPLDWCGASLFLTSQNKIQEWVQRNWSSFQATLSKMRMNLVWKEFLPFFPSYDQLKFGHWWVTCKFDLITYSLPHKAVVIPDDCNILWHHGVLLFYFWLSNVSKQSPWSFHRNSKRGNFLSMEVEICFAFSSFFRLA